VAAGHGVLAQMLLLLDDSSVGALAVDARLPSSALKVHAAVVDVWPRLADRIAFLPVDMDEVEILPGDLVGSVHACGALTDRVLDRAIRAKARVVVLPCCHDRGSCEAGPVNFENWIDSSLAIDIARAERLAAAGYRVWTQAIASTITPKNRLLMGEPADA